MTLTAFVFPKLRTLKTWLDKCLKRPISENPSASNIVNLPKHCWNQHSGTFIIFIDHCQRKLSWKRSLLLTWKILGLLVNTLAGDEMYLVLHRKNLTIAIQMQLSQKQKTFSQFLVHFGNLFEISNVLNKRMTLIGFVLPKLRTPKMWLDKCLKCPVS